METEQIMSPELKRHIRKAVSINATVILALFVVFGLLDWSGTNPGMLRNAEPMFIALGGITIVMWIISGRRT